MASRNQTAPYSSWPGANGLQDMRDLTELTISKWEAYRSTADPDPHHPRHVGGDGMRRTDETGDETGRMFQPTPRMDSYLMIAVLELGCCHLAHEEPETMLASLRLSSEMHTSQGACRYVFLALVRVHERHKLAAFSSIQCRLAATFRCVCSASL